VTVQGFTCPVVPASHFHGDGERLGAGVRSNGTASFTISDLPIGTDRIVATFSGGPGFTFSRSTALVEIVNAAASEILEALLETLLDPRHRDRLFAAFPA
jgi:hypothetical protein